MTYIIRKGLQTFPYLEEHIAFLYQSRKNLSRKQRVERVGINYSIILLSACFVEGRIEHDLKNLLSHRKFLFNGSNENDFYKRRLGNSLWKNFIELTESDISRTTGIRNFEKFIKLLSYKNHPTKYESFSNWEGLTVMFNFRNVLAHGREVTVKSTLRNRESEDWEYDFKEGFSITQKYLKKRKLINRVFEDHGTDSATHLFTNKVTDHFYAVAKGFSRFHLKLVNQEQKKFNMKQFHEKND